MTSPDLRTIRSAALLVAVTVLITAPTAALAFSLASHRFVDVRDGSTHAAGIEWLADSGVTSGCGADGFCPGDEVTRGQMATFLYRLAGNDPAVGPIVDAATVQGVAITDLGSAIADASCPANQVVAGFSGGSIVCQPVTSITSADGSHTVTVTDDGVTITGIDGSIRIDQAGIRVESSGSLVLDGASDATLTGGAGASVRSSGVTSIDGSLVQLNGGSGCAMPVARMGDPVVAAGGSGTITMGSSTVLAC